MAQKTQKLTLQIPEMLIKQARNNNKDIKTITNKTIKLLDKTINKKPKILIIGGCSLLGQYLIKESIKRGYETHYTYHKNWILTNHTDRHYVNITNKEHIQTVINIINPDIIILTAALTNVDYCETHIPETYLTNVLPISHITKIYETERKKPKIIYISSGYAKNPTNHYGISKLEGEIALKRYPDHLIIRTMLIYGQNIFKKNFATWVIRELRHNNQIKVVTDQNDPPTHANDLAKAILDLYEKNCTGTYNITGEETISRADFAREICTTFNLNKKLLTITTSDKIKQKAKRPTNTKLSLNKIHKLGIKTMTVKEGLELLKTEDPSLI